MHGGLARTPLSRLRLGGIQPVFQDIQIESAHVDSAEIVERMKHGMELEFLVGLPHPLDQLLQPSSAQRSISSRSLSATLSVAGSKSARLPRR